MEVGNNPRAVNCLFIRPSVTYVVSKRLNAVPREPWPTKLSNFQASSEPIDYGDTHTRGGDYRGDGGTRPPNILVGGDANVNVPPTNCPFSYFVDISHLSDVCKPNSAENNKFFCVLMVNLN